jgi:hypothetical protein
LDARLTTLLYIKILLRIPEKLKLDGTNLAEYCNEGCDLESAVSSSLAAVVSRTK